MKRWEQTTRDNSMTAGAVAGSSAWRIPKPQVGPHLDLSRRVSRGFYLSRWQ
jgi:hypothetical protein